MEVQLTSAEKLKLFYDKVVGNKIYVREQVLRDYLRESSSILQTTELEIKGYIEDTSDNQLNEVVTMINQKRKAFDCLYHALDEPVMVYIIGDNGLGKTTLAQALIGEQSPVVSDETVLDTYALSKSSTSELTVILKNQETEHMTFQMGLDYLQEVQSQTIATETMMEKKYKLLCSKYERNELALIELNNAFKKGNRQTATGIEEIICTIENNELLKNFTIVDTNDLSSSNLSDFYKADVILYFINRQKMYFKQEPKVLDFLMKRKTIGILNGSDEIRKNDGETGVQSLLKDAKNVYKNNLKTILPLSASEAFNGVENKSDDLKESSGLNQLIDEMNKQFLTHEMDIKIEGKLHGAELLVESLNRGLAVFLSALRKQYKRRASIKTNYNEMMHKESNLLKVKVDWLLNNYELTTKNNIELKCKELIDLGGDIAVIRDYVENDMFAAHQFKNDLVKLKENITVLYEKLYNKCILDYQFKQYEHLQESNLWSNDATAHEEESAEKLGVQFLNQLNVDAFEVLNTVDLNILISPISGKLSFMMPFAKKKKLGHIQMELTAMLDNSITQLKELFYAEINQHINRLNEEVYANIEETFKALYCNPKDVSRILVLLEELDKKLIIPPLKLSLKDIILNKKKLSY